MTLFKLEKIFIFGYFDTSTLVYVLDFLFLLFSPCLGLANIL